MYRKEPLKPWLGAVEAWGSAVCPLQNRYSSIGTEEYSKKRENTTGLLVMVCDCYNGEYGWRVSYKRAKRRYGGRFARGTAAGHCGMTH